MDKNALPSENGLRAKLTLQDQTIKKLNSRMQAFEDRYQAQQKKIELLLHKLGDSQEMRSEYMADTLNYSPDYCSSARGEVSPSEKQQKQKIRAKRTQRLKKGLNDNNKPIKNNNSIEKKLFRTQSLVDSRKQEANAQNQQQQPQQTSGSKVQESRIADKQKSDLNNTLSYQENIVLQLPLLKISKEKLRKLDTQQIMNRRACR